MFLVAAEILKMKDPIAELESLGLYMATVLAGLAIHGLIILPLLYVVFVRRNPITYIAGMMQALVTAFGTASRYVGLPFHHHQPGCIHSKACCCYPAIVMT